MKLVLVLGVLFVMSGLIAGTYAATKHYVYKIAYAKGYDSGLSQAHVNDTSTVAPIYQQWLDQQSKSPAPTPSPVYVTPPATPTHCTSTRYGINDQFTSTNCY